LRKLQKRAQKKPVAAPGSDRQLLRAGIGRDVRELSESSARNVAEGKESVVWFGTPEAFEAEVQRRLDGSPGYRVTRLQGTDGEWGPWARMHERPQNAL
jgi:hypothetical protein